MDPELEEALEAARRDIAEVGWHVVGVQAEEGEAPFLYTVGLWQTWGHPELILFAPFDDPASAHPNLAAAVERIAAGETLASGRPLPGLFAKFPGQLQAVASRWYPYFLGFAGFYYGSWNFPARQLFFPDAAGLFPWDEGFDAKLYRRQPWLFDDNLVLANLPASTLGAIDDEEGDEPFTAATAELLAALGPLTGELSPWRWKIGAEAQVIGATVFGDFLLYDPSAGSCRLLDVGNARSSELCAELGGWTRACALEPRLLKGDLLARLRLAGAGPAAGEIYGWRHAPCLGGDETLANLERRPAAEHFAASASLAASQPKTKVIGWWTRRKRGGYGR